MILRRVGLVLALLLSLTAVVPALDIAPDPSTGAIGPLPVVVAILSCAIAAVTVALLVPAWRGSRWASITIATAQLAGILTALPAFFAPAGIVPPGGVVLATVGTLVTVAVFTMIAFDISMLMINAVAVIVIIALYASVVAVVTLLVPPAAERFVQTFAAIAVALAFQPLVLLMRRTVGRALYGGKVAPAATAVRIGRPRIDATDPVAAVVQDTATALRLPRIELISADHVVAVGTSGARAGAAVDLPLDHAGRTLLRITLRSGERTLDRDDRDALTLIALALAPLVRESDLLTEVRAGRAAVADAREREQLSLHRDLHDGLGPLLTGAVMRADAARNLLDERDDAAREQLDAARVDLRTAIAELRRVVYGLWPLELEQRGLPGAISTRAERAGIAAQVPADLALPPAVELAIYRIASEAITNIEKHASGAPALLVLESGANAVVLTVTNQASAETPSAPGGLGLASMRMRADELGGQVEAAPTSEGWVVRARIPLSAPAAPPGPAGVTG